MLRSLPAYRDEGRPFEAFVYRVAASKVVDARRRSGRDAVPTDTVPEAEDAGRGPEDTVLLREDADRVRDLMDRLPERQREVLELRVAVGMTAEETGRVLGMSPGAVRVTQHRALARLRTMVAEVPA